MSQILLATRNDFNITMSFLREFIGYRLNLEKRFQYFFCAGWHVKPKNTSTKAECNRFFVHFEVLANLILVPESVYKRTVSEICALCTSGGKTF